VAGCRSNQEIARRIGAERMQKYLDLLNTATGYGGGIRTQFWLTWQLADQSGPSRSISSTAAARTLPAFKTQPGRNGARYPSRPKQDFFIIRAKSGLLGAEIGKGRHWLEGGWAE